MIELLNKSLTVIIILIIITLTGCSEDKNPAQNTDTESMPVINTISTDKTKILYGGYDKAIIKCDATGGNLKYVWQVDIGDLIPLNKDRSEVSFKGSACCVGEKIITCTVSNSKGSVSQNIILDILEETSFPEIITFSIDKSELQSNISEQVNIACHAYGGFLHFAWEADCGEITVNPEDNAKITYTATPQCIGDVIIKCTVTNDKGYIARTVKLTVK